MKETLTLREGLWLGSENRIVAMKLFKYGWRVTDSTGEHYSQKDFREGLKAATEPTDGLTLTIRIPWPPKAQQ